MKYEIGLKIKNLRESKGISQKDFALMIGVSNSRLSNWEQGKNRPDVNNLSRICEVLGVSADNLLGVYSTNTPNRSWAEPLVTAYETKENSTQKAVCAVLEIPHVIPSACDGNKKKEAEHISTNTIRSPKQKTQQKREMTEVSVSDVATAAGSPAYISSDDFEIIPFPASVVPYQTEFGLKVKGNSMEPTIPDGAVVFVRRVFDLQNNDIGIFVLDGTDSVCKRFFRKGRKIELHSDNKAYDPIKIGAYDEALQFGGKVLGWYHPEFDDDD